jgi:hypothetical protein
LPQYPRVIVTVGFGLASWLNDQPAVVMHCAVWWLST